MKLVGPDLLLEASKYTGTSTSGFVGVNVKFATKVGVAALMELGLLAEEDWLAGVAAAGCGIVTMIEVDAKIIINNAQSLFLFSFLAGLSRSYFGR